MNRNDEVAEAALRDYRTKYTDLTPEEEGRIRAFYSGSANFLVLRCTINNTNQNGYHFPTPDTSPLALDGRE